MNGRLRILVPVLCGVLPGFVALAGCGGSSSPSSAVTSVSASCVLTVVPTGASTQCSASVQGTGTFSSAVVWSVNGATGGSSTLGTISTTGLYTAPSTPPTPPAVTIAATSSQDSTKSGPVQVTVAALTLSPAAAQMPVAGQQKFGALLNGQAVTTVAWSVNGVAGGNSTVGTIDATGLYVAPTLVPSPSAVTVRATSQTYPTASGSATVTIGPYVVSGLYSFTGLADGAGLSGPLLQASNGAYFGTAQIGGTNGFGTVFTTDSAGHVTPVHQFSNADGANPIGAMIQASDLNLYGTTAYGGTSNHGVVFRMNLAGSFSTLYSFSGSNDGSEPTGGVIQAADGSFYGTTYAGGTSNAGTVFRIGSTGTLTTIYTFSGGADGKGPEGSLVDGGDGFIYGTTEVGGNLTCQVWPIAGCGTVFKIDSSGHLTTLHSFSGGADGANPAEGLIVARDGYLYGTTLFGGDSSCQVSSYTGCGTIFKISAAGSLQTLHAFSGAADGGVPFSSLLQASDGDFYGTTTAGGNQSCLVIAAGEQFSTYIGCGTVFKMDTAGHVSALYSFNGTPGGGSNPFSALIQGSDGYFYGSTRWGGSAVCSYTNDGGCGTIFRLAGPAGPLTALRGNTATRVLRALSPSSAPWRSNTMDSGQPLVPSQGGPKGPGPITGLKRDR
jgi:uncharacterized repeat protein (TIGR03803 family)